MFTLIYFYCWYYELIKNNMRVGWFVTSRSEYLRANLGPSMRYLTATHICSTISFRLNLRFTVLIGLWWLLLVLLLLVSFIQFMLFPIASLISCPWIRCDCMIMGLNIWKMVRFINSVRTWSPPLATRGITAGEIHSLSWEIRIGPELLVVQLWIYIIHIWICITDLHVTMH